MARRLQDAAGPDRRTLPGLEALVRSIRRWESGAIGSLSERYRLLFCAAFDLGEDALFDSASGEFNGASGEALPTARTPREGGSLRLLISPSLQPILRDIA
jgi:hypothetical protein